MIDEPKDLYNVHNVLDPTIGLWTTLNGLDRFVDVAMWCVEESRDDRPSMSEVVKEIENIMQLAGWNPIAESASTSANYEENSKGFDHPYSKESLSSYSERFPLSKLDPSSQNETETETESSMRATNQTDGATRQVISNGVNGELVTVEN
ncbi:hypothetical protein F0562_020147 [Nyssa sinensis]|uniref:Serine-threonine/tyrosine-protein kinase catalytic domain-containing protein n=1 Tax=Nyssa sinensis TaxID=561372 RepID=A0A5J5BQC4_9ASTE|nr:hypothetical protein F0562_020147 [Nyssa sinensis]